MTGLNKILQSMRISLGTHRGTRLVLPGHYEFR